MMRVTVSSDCRVGFASGYSAGSDADCQHVGSGCAAVSEVSSTLQHVGCEHVGCGSGCTPLRAFLPTRLFPLQRALVGKPCQSSADLIDSDHPVP